MMEKFMERGIIRQRGITLIALVITIIVLLILAGVTIAALSGDNGILTRAAESKNKTEEAQEKEGLKLAVTSSQMEDVNTLEIDKEKLENAIKQQFGNNKDFSVTDNKDGSFLVNMNDTQGMYYIDETGEIIEQSKMLKISTADELKAFRDDVNSGNTYEGWYVYLANDISLDINEEWEPIGLHRERTGESENKPFKGIFNGNWFQIDCMKIDSLGYTGLFGFVRKAVIKNVGIGENCDITNCGNGTHIGAVVGFLYDESTIKNCYNLSNISGDEAYEIGGIVGTTNLNCNIYNCFNKGNIFSNILDKTNPAFGGIVGNLIAGNVKNCYNTGRVKSGRRRRDSWASS